MAPQERGGGGGGGHQGEGMHQGVTGGGRENRQREGSSRRAKKYQNAKGRPQVDSKAGRPSAFDSMD